MGALSLNTVFAQENNANGNSEIVKGSSLELPQIQVVPIRDTKTERNYELYIELPEDYSENNNKTYPVLYYTDAMWHMEMLSACQEYILEDIILVGISWQLDINEDLKNEVGAHVSRFRDYSISKHSNPEIQKKYQPGQAKTHLDFIRNDVIKYIDNTYRTDINNRTYFGYSLSGEFGAYILLAQPDTFDNYIIGSPTVKGEIDNLSDLNTKFGPFDPSNNNSSLNANVYISYGSLEEEAAEPINEFISLLNNRRDDGLSVLKEVIDGSHQTAFPSTVVRGVTWLSNVTKDGEFPPLENRYLGQEPPDLTPQVFAPGIVSTEEYLETVVTFLPDMRELSFTRSGGKYKEPTLFVMQNKNNKWSRKPIPSTDIKEYKERFNPSVSEIKNHEPFKEIPIVGFSVSSNGTYYFYVLDFDDGGSGHMSYSRLIDGKYETPQKLSKAINRGKYIAHPFIAPDESYLIWDAEIEGETTPDVFISFRQKDGSWGTAINMGDQINTPLYEQHARVTPDGKYLFFWRGDVKVREDGSRYVIGSPYWVDAKIIETLRPN